MKNEINTLKKNYYRVHNKENNLTLKYYEIFRVNENKNTNL
jgi:hypothetical protein